MRRIAALPMYDLPEMQPANDAYWADIALRLLDGGVSDVPFSLTRGVDLHALWTDPALLLAQTCGYPLTTSLRGKVALVATPCYAAEGCDGPYGRSAIIVRATNRAIVLADLRNRICAVNAPDSNSGMNLLRAAIAPLAGGQPFFSRVVMTGAHTESARAVAEGEADTAAIDCVTWALLQRFRPALCLKLRVLAWTVSSAWLPLVTAVSAPASVCDVLFESLRPNQELLIEAYTALPQQAYDSITSHEASTVCQL